MVRTATLIGITALLTGMCTPAPGKMAARQIGETRKTDAPSADPAPLSRSGPNLLNMPTAQLHQPGGACYRRPGQHRSHR
jgi:hypothetical protein